jgi:large subunit ribosomal protein L23
MDTSVVLKPVLSEKAYGLSQARNTYVFVVPKDANKHIVARAVASQFDVTVVNVNITNIAGKAKRTVNKKGKSIKGYQNDARKAYVTLKAGESLPIFAALEEETKAEEKAAEKAAKATKASKTSKEEKGKDK